MSECDIFRDRNKAARLFGQIAIRAGRAIMKAREARHHPEYKSDGSPVTAADLAADEIIRDSLARHLPGLPVITEETCTAASAADAACFALVDPLDGTKEFIKGSDEFTVNIALIADHLPVAGAVYAPALRRLYVGGASAHRLDATGDDAAQSLDGLRPIRVRQAPRAGWRAVVSRSHLDPDTRRWIEAHRIAELCSAGSSLKFCTIAEGEADVYPRLGPTMEWDTAAGHAVLLAAGGRVTDLDGQPMRYGKPAFRNGSFVAWGTADDGAD
ncbi:MAG TPA: 3'(2'),5'-bisphosphate nucleotidase CysQ [Bradyrhizobium sp.]|uniref:3'(2'),5'-bisphosphate nucleotidase CysQ n=1 Tax=Bradyrhizobium sp. TaxID=376 RepID=UPI002C636952|nr:3'(2'),5'-bisphosphate nucleotidase CysQ [Bradyrhizobium sp.]HLZ02864.1 3'(2'),5'-bisphosphate nucleotidase CysQ [Bradyrhizobium sp.]